MYTQHKTRSQTTELIQVSAHGQSFRYKSSVRNTFAQECLPED